MAKNKNKDKKKDEKPKEKPEKVKTDFKLNKQNKYLVIAFKKSEYYNKDITNEELEERFNKFKKE